MAKKNPIQAAAKKMVSAPVSNIIEAAAEKKTEVKAAEVKTEETKTAEVKAEETKTESTKKAPAKKPAAKEIKTSIVVQFAGKEVTEKELIASVKKSFTKKGNKVGDIKTMEIYVKPEDGAAYYVINGVGSDDYKVEL